MTGTGGKFRPKAIVFDLDGTVGANPPEISSALKADVSKNGIACLPMAEVQGVIGGGAADALQRALARRGIELDGAAFKSMLGVFYDVYAEVSKKGNGLYA